MPLRHLLPSLLAICTIAGAADVDLSTTAGGLAANGSGAVTAIDGLTLTIPSGQVVDVLYVTISSGLVPGDVLAFSNTAAITSSFNAMTGVLTLTAVTSGTVSAIDWAAAVATVTFTPMGNGTRTISARLFGSKLVTSYGGHAYIANTSGNITWSAAKALAETKSLMGSSGYLATVTSADENTALATMHIGRHVYLGGSDSYQVINANAGTTYSDQTETEGNFCWVTGPEVGQTLASTYANWGTNEPNGGTSGNALQAYYNSAGALGVFDDTGGTSNDVGYVVEFGDNDGDPIFGNLVASRTITVSGIASDWSEPHASNRVVREIGFTSAGEGLLSDDYGVVYTYAADTATWSGISGDWYANSITVTSDDTVAMAVDPDSSDNTVTSGIPPVLFRDGDGWQQFASSQNWTDGGSIYWLVSGATGSAAAGHFYALGEFTMTFSDSTTAKDLMEWTGSDWAAVPGWAPPYQTVSGASGYITATATGSDGSLAVAFAYNNGASSLNQIWRFHASTGTWTDLTGADSGMDNDITALAIADDGSVYAGGNFSSLGALSLPTHIAKWTAGGGWSAVGSGTSDTGIAALAVDGKGQLYVGGAFSTLDGSTLRGLARWNGTAWTDVGQVFVSTAETGTVDVIHPRKNGELFIGGEFTYVSGVAAKNFAKTIWNHAPTDFVDADSGANAVTVVAAAGTAAGVTANASDADGDALTYALSGSDDGFAIDANTGVVTTARALTAADFGVHTVTLVASDGRLTASTDVAITVSGVTIPADANASADTVSEDAVSGAAVGITAHSSGSATVAYALGDDAGGLFAIDSATGVVTAHVSLIGRAGTHHITVTATSDGVSTSADFTITVTDVNHAPTGLTDTDTAANTVSEDTVIGSSVGLTIAASDTDGDTLTYTLSSDAGGLFAINTTTGVVTAASSLSGKAGSYTVTATASDGALSASADFTITVTDVNHAPTGLTDTDIAANTVSEDTATGSSVGLTIAASDTDGDTLTYTLSSDAGGLFAINATTGVVTVASSLSGKAGSYTVTATASDGALSASADFTITVDAVTSSTGTDSGSSGGSGGCGLGSSSALIALLGLGGFLALALRRRRI
jgi:hypothetical protein